MENIDLTTLRKIGAGIAIGFGTIGPGIGIGWATAHALDAIARNPEVTGEIRTTLIIGIGLAEATAIYAFVIAIILNFT